MDLPLDAATATATTPRRPDTRPRRALRAAARGTGYCAALVPLAVAALGAALTGRPRRALGRWRRLREGLLRAPAPGSRHRPGSLVVAGHALGSLLIGLVAVLPLGTLLAFVLRGVLYGIVDPGPYVRSWGGPTRAGAWAVHVLVGLPLAVLALAALVGIAAVHQRLTRALDERRLPARTVAVALVMAAGGALLFVAWLHQL